MAVGSLSDQSVVGRPKLEKKPTQICTIFRTIRTFREKIRTIRTFRTFKKNKPYVKKRQNSMFLYSFNVLSFSCMRV